MKKMINFLKHYPYLVICIVALVILFPPSIASPPESDKRAIITTTGFDLLENNEIEVSVVMLSPIENANFEQNDTIVSAKGETIGSALTNLSLHVGKPVGLAHNEAIVIGERLAQSNLSDRLDNIARNKDISNNIPIIICRGLAKNLITTCREISESTGLSISELLFYNEEFIMSVNTTLESFYKALFSPSKSVLVSCVYLDKEEQETSQNESSSNDSKGQESSSNKGAQVDSLRNDGESSLIKNGKHVSYLDKNQTRGICWVDHTASLGAIEVDNVNSKLLNNAKLHVSIRDKRVNKASYFENGKPVVKFVVTLAVQIKEIYQEGADKDILNNNIHYLTDEVKKEIEHSIKEDFSSALATLKEYNADVIGAYDLLYRNNKDEFKKYLSKLDNEDEYFDTIGFRFVVDCIEYK